ncbi:MAG: hypothetical protein U9Q70_08435 [Chloroflexota bacterium]|nr:hypothetical protein [Chloroflexota bacterium]
MPSTDLVAALMPVVNAFERLDIAYYIGGSVASSAYGIARATMDVDMVAALEVQHVNTLVQQLKDNYYIDGDMILDAINHESSFNLIHLKTMLKVDIFVLKNEPYHHTALERRRKDTLDEVVSPEFYFISAEDIILSKLDWYRLSGEMSRRQWKDVLGVLKVQGQLLDITYLEQCAAKLELADLLERAFVEAGLLNNQKDD